jgi:hypothetical protein
MVRYDHRFVVFALCERKNDKRKRASAAFAPPGEKEHTKAKIRFIIFANPLYIG